jgi:hypothetical protein
LGEYELIRLIIVTFGFLGWAFYEMSGGADFDPQATRMARIDVPESVEEEKLDAVSPDTQAALPQNVTRIALNLNSVQDVVRPARTLQTETPPVLSTAQELETALSEEEPTVVLPSLLFDRVVITPVDFGAETSGSQVGIDIRAVSGNSVNVRGGPGTNYSVVNRLVRGDQVEVLQNPGDGWVKLRPVDGGQIGWMAEFLLTEG